MISIDGGSSRGCITALLHCRQYRQMRQRIGSRFIL